MKPVEAGEVLTPEELAIYRRVAEAGIRLAKSLGRSDKVARLTKLLNEAEEQTCQVYPTK